MLSAQIGHGHLRRLDQVLWIDFELQSPHAGTHVDDVEQLAGLMDEGGEWLLHADGRTTATDVAREGQQFLHRDEVAALVACDFGGLFEVHLLVAWDDTDEMACFIAFQDQGFEHLVDVFAQLVGDMLRPKVVFIHLVGNQLILDFLLVKQPAGVGFVDFFFRHDISF